MIESLLAPRERPAWQAVLFNALALAGIGLFLITSSVAFLREAKAVRVARRELAADHPESAKAILKKFLERHSDHEEALLLGTLAAALSEDLEQTGHWRGTVMQRYPDRLEELDPQIQVAIKRSILARGCNHYRLLEYFGGAEALGETFHPVLLSNIQDAARRCLASDHEGEALALVAALVRRGEGSTLIEEVFLEPLRKAIASGRYNEAERLGREAASFSKETAAAANETLEVVRKKVEVSLRHLAAACRDIRAAPGSRVGRFWCFPRSMPGTVANTQDGWGRPLRYRPLDLDTTLQCYQGFEIFSLGADGNETSGATGNPDADSACRFVQGREQWQVPGAFWRVQR